MDFLSAAQQVVGYTAPAPTTQVATPGHPVTTVGTHTDAGACGCGGSHAPVSIAVAAPAPTLAPPHFLQASMLQTPPDFHPPPLAGDFAMFDFSNWRADWWKYIAGALLYKLLRD